MTQYKAVAPHALRIGAIAMAAALAACATKPPVSLTAAPPLESSISTTADAMAGARDVAPATSLEEAQAGARDYGMGLNADAPLRYVVKKGDTLWGIASKFLADPWQWPELWYVNGQLKNPHKIYPGDVLELYNVGGRTMLVRGEDLERLSPQIRESDLGDGLQAIPIDAIRNFLNGPRVVDIDIINKAPYILSFTDDHIVGAANMGVFVKRLGENDGSNFNTARRGVVYKDPDTGEILGYEVIPSGDVEIRTPGSPAEGMLTASRREIMPGDILLAPEAENFQANFYPHVPANPVDGKIISVYEGVSNIAQYQIVALNRGTKQGLEPGHVLRIKQSPRKIKDPVTGKVETLPSIDSGLLMIFRTMPGVSYGLIMDSTRAIRLFDRVEKPQPGSIAR